MTNVCHIGQRNGKAWHFWRPKYFEDLLNRLETNSDVDPSAVELDKKKFLEMKNIDQNKEIANRNISEILSRFDR